MNTTHNPSITHRRMSMIFNEWAKRYSENPNIFSSIIGADGKPVSDYGDCCAIYFCELATELDAAGLLPVPDLRDVRPGLRPNAKITGPGENHV